MDRSSQKDMVRLLAWGCAGTAVALLLLLILLAAISYVPMPLSLPFAAIVAAVSLWPYCLGAVLLIGGIIALFRFLDRKYGKISIALALAASSLLALLPGIGLTCSGAVKFDDGGIGLLVAGIGIGILGLSLGLAAGIVYLFRPSSTDAKPTGPLQTDEKATEPGQSVTSLGTLTGGSPTQEPAPGAHHPSLTTRLGITCLLSAVLGAVFVGTVIFIVAGLAFLVWLLRDFDLMIL